MLEIVLPNQIITFIDRQATADGFQTPSEYVCHLILQEQKRLTQRERVKLLLIEGLDSGESIEATDDWWNQQRTKLEDLHQSKA